MSFRTCKTLVLWRSIARQMFGLLILLAVVGSGAMADPPYVSYIFPAGGQRGATVDVRVGGHYLHDRCAFIMLGPGVQASQQLTRADQTVWFEGPVIPMPDSQRKEDYPKDQCGTVRIDKRAPIGFRHWHVWTSQGATASMNFVVGDLPEVVEDEIDGDPIPTRVVAPVTINGRIFPREDVDIWAFAAQAGESFSCSVLAARLGSPLDAHLAVFGPSGKRIAESTSSPSADAFVRFTAPEDGAYQVRIYDFNFGGLQHYVYRLTITGGPFVDHVYPLGGRRGTQVRFEAAGQNLLANEFSISLPDDGSDSFRHRLQSGKSISNEFAIRSSDLPERLETEPNNTRQDAGQAGRFIIPVVLNGRVGSPGDMDTWMFSGKQGTHLEFDLHAARCGSLLDSVILVLDRDGKELAQADDSTGVGTDSRLQFKVPADGDYFVRVQDRIASRGGAAFAYRLYAQRFQKAPPSFQLRLATDALTLNRGEQAKLKVSVDRAGGFNEPIELIVGPLPSGVTVDGQTIAAKKKDAQLVFKAESVAKVQAVRVKVVGVATMNGQSVARTAVVPAESSSDFQRDSLLLGIAQPTPFKVVGIFESKFAARGSTYHRRFAIERNGFEGPITVCLADRQVRHLQGVTGPTIVVPPESSEFDYPIALPPWMEVGRTSRTCVMAVGMLADAQGTQHKVSYTSHAQNDQIIVLVAPGQLSIDTTTKSLRVQAGEVASVPLRIGRGKDLNGPAEVDLIVPEHVRGVEADPVILAADESTTEFTVRFADGDLGPFNAPLTLRVTMADARGNPVLDETDLWLVQPE